MIKNGTMYDEMAMITSDHISAKMHTVRVSLMR